MFTLPHFQQSKQCGLVLIIPFLDFGKNRVIRAVLSTQRNLRITLEMQSLAPRIRFCRGQGTLAAVCRSYKGPRSDLLSSINAMLLPRVFSYFSNEFLLTLILYGDERLIININKELIEVTIKLIHVTEHFQMFHCYNPPYVST